MLSQNLAIAKDNIAERYELADGKGASTSLTLIGGISHNTPINYYLSLNVCKNEEIWMIHFIPWTTYKVRIPYSGKVLIKTFENSILELCAFTKDDGVKLENVFVNKKRYERYISGAHCKLTYDQLLKIIEEGVYKIRIQTDLPNGYIERTYCDNYVALSLKEGHDILLNELREIDIYDGF